ncbi:TspO/MBR family protein [Sphingomonas cavernae]|uniref:Tryptophan-rich sensory protein n=1 Tax=Sphingomonas cavernae TaxID=2320861 RepID=A0A418WL34_9SPHN|nr:TspO/MBR family protein [Sphingomonas cavernae]RJF90743.1 tryptophan-rich sensory protein [Sphingomonas cavernae]
MTELASQSQLRGSLFRWALVTVPATVLLGVLSGRLSNSGYGNPWFDALQKPDIMPPGWVFGAAWTLLYVLMGLAAAVVLNARGANGRPLAIALFIAQFVANLAWSPLFFAAHQVSLALWLILLILVLAVATTAAFGRVRAIAAWLMVPYLAWLCFASLLNWQIDRLNPDAETLVRGSPKAQIAL